MDQSHSVCPYLGRNDSLGSDSLTLGITGVKEHGKDVVFYITNDTVQKGANLTIHCISAHIERWIQNHDGRSPEELFVQVKFFLVHRI
jgi:hypothetical protein